MSLKSPNKPFVCAYCNKGFVREKTFSRHVCEKKRRALQKNEPNVRIAFEAYNQFFEISMYAKNKKTYEEFSKSELYNEFVKFGSFVANAKPLYPEKYITFLIRNEVKLKNWSKDEIYEGYAIGIIYNEDVTVALERSVQNMISWGDEMKDNWQDYFRKATSNRISRDIKDGKISPWILFNSKSGKEVLSKFSDEELTMMSTVLNVNRWARKFDRDNYSVKLAKDVSKKANL